MTRIKTDIFNGTDPLLVARTTEQQRDAAIRYVQRQSRSAADELMLLTALGLVEAP